MTKAAKKLSREALGTRRFTYTVAVTQEADGTFALVVAATGLQGEHRMPEPQTERRPFAGPDIDDLGRQATAFLSDWRQSHPACANQILCCTKVVENALKRAKAALVAGPRPPGHRSATR